MIFASITNGGDKTKNPEILTTLVEIMWPVYESTFKSKCKFIECINCTTLGILDASESRFENTTVKDVFYIVKKNWNKNHKYIQNIK